MTSNAAATMAFKPIDPKRDEFRRYLEKYGVIETLTKAFVRIVKERPENPMDYLKHNLGDNIQPIEDYIYLQRELEESRDEVKRLRAIIEKISPESLNELHKIDNAAVAASNGGSVNTEDLIAATKELKIKSEIKEESIEQNPAETTATTTTTTIMQQVEDAAHLSQAQVEAENTTAFKIENTTE